VRGRGLLLGLKLRAEPRDFVAIYAIITATDVSGGDNHADRAALVIGDAISRNSWRNSRKGGELPASRCFGMTRISQPDRRSGDAIAAMLSDALDRKAARQGCPRAGPTMIDRSMARCWR